MNEAQFVSSPMVASCKLSKTRSDIFSDPTLYRSVVGALQYATLTRPEINYVVSKVCQFMSNPLEGHWTAVKRILRYLKGTISYGLHIQPTSTSKSLSITALYDADWASDVDDRKSTSGSTIFLASNLISGGLVNNGLLLVLVLNWSIAVLLSLLLKFYGFKIY